MSARTEAPTPRRLREARRRGEIPTSRDLTASGALAGGLLGLVVSAPSTLRLVADGLRSGILIALDASALPGAAALDALRLLARTSSAPLGGAIAGALLLGSIQARGLFTLEATRFRWERLDPLRSVRLVSGARLSAVALGIVKAVTLIVLGWYVTRDPLRSAAELTRAPTARLLSALGHLVLAVGAPVALAALAFGTLDWILARRRHRERLQMTREEVRREQRDDQGDPQHRAERRRLHRSLATAPPLRHAACVVVNPTHVAVALHHDRGGDDAPVVVAKGQGRAATALRASARRSGVPIVEDVALARALFRLAEVGDQIPEELYEAAALVLAELYRRHQETP